MLRQSSSRCNSIIAPKSCSRSSEGRDYRSLMMDLLKHPDRYPTYEIENEARVSDNQKVKAKIGWKPEIGPDEIVSDVLDWISKNEITLKPIFLIL